METSNRSSVNPMGSINPAKVDGSADKFAGCLLGTAVGDALGLPYEGLTPARLSKLMPEIGRHHFLFGRGMVSDDTDHACFVAQALLQSRGDDTEFEKSLARHLTLWLACIPAGIGLATLRATLRLWRGVSPTTSGVFSAGNGPAMRSALIGLCYGEHRPTLRRLVRSSTLITHSDPKAEVGALAVAVAAHIAATASGVNAEIFLDEFTEVSGKLAPDLPQLDITEFVGIVKSAAKSAEADEDAGTFAARFGHKRGVTGYIYHTVPVVLQAWLRHPLAYRTGVIDIIRAGGDTDTTAAILGALIGARVGADGIPAEWLRGLWEWPRSATWMLDVSKQLSNMPTGSVSVPPLAAWQIPLRNTIFTGTVLAHGFRRLLPPY